MTKKEDQAGIHLTAWISWPSLITSASRPGLTPCVSRCAEDESSDVQCIFCFDVPSWFGSISVQILIWRDVVQGVCSALHETSRRAKIRETSRRFNSSEVRSPSVLIIVRLGFTSVRGPRSQRALAFPRVVRSQRAFLHPAGRSQRASVRRTELT